MKLLVSTSRIGMVIFGQQYCFVCLVVVVVVVVKVVVDRYGDPTYQGRTTTCSPCNGFPRELVQVQYSQATLLEKLFS